MRDHPFCSGRRSAPGRRPRVGRTRARLSALAAAGASVAAAALAAGCASQPARKTTRIDLPPSVITAGPPEEIALSDKDEASLFDGGMRAFAAGDYEKAARHFDRLVEVFPEAANALPALYDAALSQERLKRWGPALERFERYLARAPRGADAVDAAFHAALAEHELGRLPAAAARLHALSELPGLPRARRAEALVQEAVTRIESGGPAEGERLLRAALASTAGDPEGPADPALEAQAEFWLGEVYRGYFTEAKLDPRAMKEADLSDALEAKAKYLLSAQGHYLRAIRKGDGEWATASGFRIGGLYEAFHDQLVAAPVPAGLSSEAAEVYREELKKKVRVLVERAIRIYEETRRTAERVSAKSPYVARTDEALQRLRKLLLGPAG